MRADCERTGINPEYNPYMYKLRKDVEGEFGPIYEPIIPTEAEIRYLGTRQQRCFYYMYGLEICKYEVLRASNKSFMPCKDVLDAMWRCYTDEKYGRTLEEAPDYTKADQKKFLDCYFHKTFGLEVCLPLFSNIVRAIYRRPDSKLTQWY